MTEQHSATTLHLAITLLAACGIVSVFIGLYAGLALLLAAIVLAVAQRGALARSIRTPDTNRRRRRLATAAILASVFVASYTVFLQTVGDSWTITDTLLAAIGTPAMIASPVYLIAGLLTQKSDRRPGLATQPH